MPATGEWIDARVLIPDLLRRAPQVRPVLDRYGLHGCGGESGPQESLDFFARAHDVPLPRLLRELRQAAQEQPQPREAPAPEDTIYRPFFLAGIAATLTAGAVWGAYLLLQIGFTGSFRAVGLHEVNAHGHAQILGWVGLFVMGFAYQAFPRFKHTRLALPLLAWWSLGLMLVGLIARSVAEPLAVSQPWLVPVAVGAAWLEVVAIVLCVIVLVATWRRAALPWAVHDGYIFAALGWFLVQGIGEALYLAATFAAADREELLRLIATWQAPLRDVQIHGFALLMILGVSQRLFAPVYGLKRPSPRLARLALVLLNVAVVGETVSWVLMKPGEPLWRMTWYGAVLLLAGTVAALVYDWGLFRPAAEKERTLKFVRAAYVWLLISLAMLVLLPVYQWGALPRLAPESEAAQIGFSHAYYGAIRHAITVGFISLMIVGVASRVVPTLNGLDPRRLSGLWGPFILLNVGCSLRVVFQTFTDFAPEAFPVAGVSGLFEVAGLTWWAVHVGRIMLGKFPAEGEQGADRLRPGEPIRASHRVGDVLEQYPYLLDVFLSFGFTPLANRVLRAALAARVPIERACRFADVDCLRLLQALNAEREKREPRRVGLPVVEQPAVCR